MKEPTNMSLALESAGLTKSKRTFKKTSASALQQVMRTLNWSVRQVADALGVSESAIFHWTHKGSMPVSISIACEALLLRHNKPIKPSQVWALVLRDGVLESSTSLSAESQIVLGGKTFWLVPCKKEPSK